MKPLVERGPNKIGRFIDRIGKRYDKVTVLRLVGWRGNFNQWECRCDCGTLCVKWATAFSRSRCCCRDCRPRKYQFKSKAVKSVYHRKRFSLCEEWRDNPETFEAAVGSPPGKKYSLLRKDESRPYGPDNFRWGRYGELTLNGETLPLMGWCKRLGLSRQRIHQRLAKYPIELALGPKITKPNSKPKLENGHVVIMSAAKPPSLKIKQRKLRHEWENLMYRGREHERPSEMKRGRRSRAEEAEIREDIRSALRGGEDYRLVMYRFQVSSGMIGKCR
jgi:hypothetical protein